MKQDELTMGKIGLELDVRLGLLRTRGGTQAGCECRGESSGSMFREVGVIGQCYEQMKLAMHSLEIAKDLRMKRFINDIGVGHQETQARCWQVMMGSGIEIETCWQRGTPISIGVCFRQRLAMVIASRLVPASAHPPTTSIDSSAFPPVLQRLKFKCYTAWHYIA